MNRSTRRAVKDFIKQFALGRIAKAKKYSIDDLKKAYPFHALFFRDDALIAFKLQRSIVTAMGRGFYPKIASLIAAERYKDVRLDYKLVEDLDTNQCNKIEEIVTELRTRRRKPSHAREMSEILSARGREKRLSTVIADLYVGDFQSGPLFAEIKTPLPNLDILAESKKKLLYFQAIMNARGENTRDAYLALHHNPFVKRDLYAWPYTPMVFDMKEEVLIAEEFWDKIGGSGTYDELRSIIEELQGEIPLG